MKWEINGAARSHVKSATPALGFTNPFVHAWKKEACVQIIVTAANLHAQPHSLHENKL